MEMTFTGRNISVSDRFREYVEEKVDKVEQLAAKLQRLDIKVTKEPHCKNPETQLTVELSVMTKGPAIRAESHAADKFAAFDLAFGKLLERLRRARDKRKVHHGRHTPTAVFQATGGLEPAPSGVPLHAAAADEPVEQNEGQDHANPVEIRRKVFPATRMSVDDAVDRMELVGHPFYLFVDDATGQCAVVYRRKGWSYGIIELDGDRQEPETVETRHYRDEKPAGV
ncbi:ribosome-associated translation inhibitor RaiA [Zhihengliuella alba]|uniref:Ribosome hibernation promoting factor n=1 Tax=Zhihengliuella alba TaxID=547018 RepID=A0ABP7CY36_9MICC